MGVVVVIIVLIAIALIVAVVVTARRLAAQRASTAAAEARTTEQAAELATVNATLEDVSREKAAAEERAAAAEEATTLTAEQAELAQRQARHEADAAAEALQAAEDRTAAAERRVVDLLADRPIIAGLDADVVWSLEQARSERAWRLTMAPGPDAESVFTGTADPLLEALQVELDAAREEVGAIIELEADVSAALTSAASLLALRAAQELLAGVVRQAEETTLRLWIDGDDLVVAVRAVDEQGEPVELVALPFPPSLDIEPTDDGVRIRHAVADSDDG